TPGNPHASPAVEFSCPWTNVWVSPVLPIETLLGGRHASHVKDDNSLGLPAGGNVEIIAGVVTAKDLVHARELSARAQLQRAVFQHLIKIFLDVSMPEGALHENGRHPLCIAHASYDLQGALANFHVRFDRGDSAVMGFLVGRPPWAAAGPLA